MRILGIDPGLRATGFGLIDTRGDAMRYVASGVIRSGEGHLPERIGRLHQGIVELVREYRPTVAVCEIVFVNVNPKSTLMLGQARGAALGALVTSGMKVHEYTALQIKQAVAAPPRSRCRKWSNACCRCPAYPPPTRPTHWPAPSATIMAAPSSAAWDAACAPGGYSDTSSGPHGSMRAWPMYIPGCRAADAGNASPAAGM